MAELETAVFENLCAALLEKMGMRDVRVAKRSKEGPLYLARQRRGVSDLRVAVKLVRGSREIGRSDVQELRKDLAHYSAQMGLVLAPGEAGRDARSEASAAGQAPVALYAGEALPEEMIACRVGITVQTVEVPDVDEAFFAGLLQKREERVDNRSSHRRDRDERPEEAAVAAPPEEAVPATAQPEPAAAPEPASTAEEQSAPEPATPPVDLAEPPPQGDEPREARSRRRGGREERPRATTPSEQAWGQPAGTLRFAPPPGPTVVDAPTPPAEDSAAGKPAPGEEPPAPPPAAEPDEF